MKTFLDTWLVAFSILQCLHCGYTTTSHKGNYQDHQTPRTPASTYVHTRTHSGQQSVACPKPLADGSWRITRLTRTLSTHYLLPSSSPSLPFPCSNHPLPVPAFPFSAPALPFSAPALSFPFPAQSSPSQLFLSLSQLQPAHSFPCSNCPLPFPSSSLSSFCCCELSARACSTRVEGPCCMHDPFLPLVGVLKALSATLRSFLALSVFLFLALRRRLKSRLWI